MLQNKKHHVTNVQESRVLETCKSFREFKKLRTTRKQTSLLDPELLKFGLKSSVEEMKKKKRIWRWVLRNLADASYLCSCYSITWKKVPLRLFRHHQHIWHQTLDLKGRETNVTLFKRRKKRCNMPSTSHTAAGSQMQWQTGQVSVVGSAPLYAAATLSNASGMGVKRGKTT